MSPDVPAEAESLRDTILHAAMRLFAQQGYAPTSIREVCEAARCTKPSLYYYFDSKEDLYRKAVETELEALKQLIERSTRTPGPVRKRVVESLRDLVQHTRGNPHGMALLHRAEMETEQGRPDVDVAGARRLHMELMRHLIEQGQARGELRKDANPDDCVVILAGTLTYQFQLWILCGEPWPEGQLERTVDLIFEGIGAS
jgi:AcrR family transcriptional regulator